MIIWPLMAPSFKLVLADMKIVSSTGSTLPEPSLENTLRSHARFVFGFEEPQ